MKLQLLLYLYFVVVQSAIQLDSSYLIDEFTESTSTNPYIDDSQTIFVVVGDEGYQPSYDPATIPNWRKDIVGLWHLDETSGTNLLDSSVKNMNASLVSSSFATGRYGGGISFNGTGYVRIPKDPFRSDQPKKGFSTAVWLKYQTLTQSAIVWERLFNNYEMDLTSTGYLQCFTASLNYNWGTAIDVRSLNNSWIHVGCVWDPVTSSLQTYINGALRANNVISGFDYFRHGDFKEIYLGRRPPQYNPGPGLNGTLDEFVIWSKPLTSFDFQDLYNQSSSITPSNGISFTSKDMVLSNALEAIDIIVSWIESNPGALQLHVSTDKGNNWCLVQNGVAIGRNQTDCLFPTVNFKYRVRWNDVFSTIQRINISFIPGPLPLTDIKPVPMGINLGAVLYYSDSWDFVDYMKFGGGDFFPSNSSVNENGYPLSIPATGVLHSLLPSPLSRGYVSGNYTLILKGTGRVYVCFAPGNLWLNSPGVYSFPMYYPDQPIGIQIQQTDSVDPINSIQLLHPGFTEADVQANPFHPFFLSRISHFSSLRFMDYGLTNGNNIVQWKDRNTPKSVGQYRPVYNVKSISSITFPFGKGGTTFTNQFACLVVTTTEHGLTTGQLVAISGTNAWITWAASDGSSNGTSYLNIAETMAEVVDSTSFYVSYSLSWWWNPTAVNISAYGPGSNGTMTRSVWAGVAVEHMVQLSNIVQADPWFNIPHLASDDYVRNMAKLIATTLSPNLKATFEYSNELWNTIFTQSAYCQKMSAKLNITKSQWIAKRTAEIYKIVDEEFEAAGAFSRLIKVMGSQAAGANWSQDLLTQFNTSQFNPNKVKVNALAIGPYFGNSIPSDLVTSNKVNTATIDDVIDACRSALRFDTYNWMTSNKKVADAFGVGLVAYEGGQHLVGVYGDINNDNLTALLTSSNRSPRMFGLYDEMMRLWSNLGGGVFQIFSYVGKYTKYGSWGILEYQAQDPATAYKYQSVTRWAGSYTQSTPSTSPSPSPSASSSSTPSTTPTPLPVLLHLLQAQYHPHLPLHQLQAYLRL